MRRFHAAAREEKPAACDGQKDERGGGGRQRAEAQAALGRRRLRLIGQRRRRRRLDLRPLADFKRIDPHRLGDVFQGRGAKIADLEIDPLLHLTIGVLGKTDRAGHANAVEARGDVDAVALSSPSLSSTTSPS